MRRKSRADNKKYDHGVALQAADSFRGHAHQFIERTPNDINEAHHYAAEHFGDLIASATSLALALEIYLKALRSVAGLAVPKTHHLWSLYKNLPEDLKRSLEQNFDQQNPSGGHDVAALEVAVVPTKTSDAFKEWDQKTERSQLETGLKGILLVASDAFESWRYLYEIQTDNGFRVVRYEFLRLDLIAYIVREHIVHYMHTMHK